MTEQIPSAAQIRAAMSLLLWENSDLAKLCGVAAQTISNIKRGTTRAQPRVLAAIRGAFENNGIAFLDSDGVRLKPEGVDMLYGPEGFLKLYMLILNQVELVGGDVCVAGVDERQFVKYKGAFSEVYWKKMAQIVKKNKKIRFRILVEEGDRNLVASSYATYRWQSKESFSPHPFYVFADYLALISFQGENAPKVILIHSATFAETYRKMFMTLWRASRPVPAA